MAQHDLESLLFRIRDGVASDAEIERAREMVASDARLPEELREVVDFVDDPEGDAVGLLAVLGADSLFGDLLREGFAEELEAALAVESEPPEITAADVDGPWPLHDDFVAAVHAEAGEVELAGGVLSAVGLEMSDMPLADALRAEAGDVELAGAVLAALGLPGFELPLADAVRREAGAVDLVQRVDLELTELGLPLAEAIRFEAGEIEIADPVLAAVGGEARPPIAEAVRQEAGTVGLWPELAPVVDGAWISAMLDRELSTAGHRAAARRLHDDPAARETMTAFASIGTDLRAAVAEEAGDCPYVWEAVAKAIGIEPEHVEGWDGEALVAALREEAGTVDLTDAVMQRVEVGRRMPSSLGEAEELPVPANASFGLGALLMMAAAVLLMVGVPNLYRGAIVETGGPSVVQVDDSAQFASAGEIVVEELDYGDNSNVYQATGDEGALILWVDEGATL